MAPNTRDAAADAEDLIPRGWGLFDLAFHRGNDITIGTARATHARSQTSFTEFLGTTSDRPAIYSGVHRAMTDMAGGVPRYTGDDADTPTVDLLVDSRRHATKDSLTGEAIVRRRGRSIGSSEITIRPGAERFAGARGVYNLAT